MSFVLCIYKKLYKSLFRKLMYRYVTLSIKNFETLEDEYFKLNYNSKLYLHILNFVFRLLPYIQFDFIINNLKYM